MATCPRCRSDWNAAFSLCPGCREDARGRLEGLAEIKIDMSAAELLPHITKHLGWPCRLEDQSHRLWKEKQEECAKAIIDHLEGRARGSISEGEGS